LKEFIDVSRVISEISLYINIELLFDKSESKNIIYDLAEN